MRCGSTRWLVWLHPSSKKAFLMRFPLSILYLEISLPLPMTTINESSLASVLVCLCSSSRTKGKKEKKKALSHVIICIWCGREERQCNILSLTIKPKVGRPPQIRSNIHSRSSFFTVNHHMFPCRLTSWDLVNCTSLFVFERIWGRPTPPTLLCCEMDDFFNALCRKVLYNSSTMIARCPKRTIAIMYLPQKMNKGHSLPCDIIWYCEQITVLTGCSSIQLRPWWPSQRNTDDSRNFWWLSQCSTED